MKHVQAADVQANFPELLAEVERGETLVIFREGREVAELVPHDRTATQRSIEAAQEIAEMRKTAPKVTTEEILEWINEGRRY